jgi:hypothetical protein
MVVESNVFIGRTIGVNYEQIMKFALKSKKAIPRKRICPYPKNDITNILDR